MTTKLSIGAILGVGLLIGCFFFAQRARTENSTGRSKERTIQQESPSDPRQESQPRARHAATAEEKARAKEELKSIPDQIRNLAETSQIDRLNALKSSLQSQLSEGKISPGQIVEMFRNEKDMSVLDVLMGVLQTSEEGNQVDVVGAFLSFAKNDGSADRRMVAIAFLGGAFDPDGTVRATLFAIAKTDADPNLRNSALSVFKEYVEKNKDAAQAVNSELLSMAQSASDGAIRTSALGAISIRAADDTTVRALGEFLAKDTTPEVRLLAAEALGEVKPMFRTYAVGELESAYTREGADGVRSMILDSLVKVGLGEALPALRRLADRPGTLQQAVLDYIQILQSGELNWQHILEEKQKLEKSRIK